MTFESQALEKAGSEQLEKVAAEFDAWRSQKKSRSDRIPESLIREAQKLSDLIDSRVVRKRLKLSSKQLREVPASKPAPSPQATSTPADFLKLSPLTVPPQQTSQVPTLRIDIRTPQGVNITLSGLAEQDPLAMIAKLIEGR